MNDQRFDCTEVEGSLPLHVGGDLEPAARDAIEAHLAFCVRCRASARAAASAREVLIAALSRTNEPTPDLWTGIRATLVREGSFGPDVPVTITGETIAGRAPAPGPRALAPRSGRWIGGGIAAAAALALGFWLVRGERVVEPAPPVVVEVPDPSPPRSPNSSGLAVPADALHEDPTAPSGSEARTADAAVGGLRRVGVAEAPFRDTAEPYVPELFSPAAGRRGLGASSPASLEIVRPIH